MDIDSLFSPIFEKYSIVDWGYVDELKAQSYPQFVSWLRERKNFPLTYLEGERGVKREHLKAYDEGIESALVFLFDYKKTKKGLDAFYQSSKSNKLKFAAYSLAYEDMDYHHQIAQALAEMTSLLEQTRPNLKTKISLDTQPVLERDLAYRAGLGWFGKNSMFIHRKQGSFHFIGSLLLNEKLSLTVRQRELDHCGQCQACVVACPTDAIDPETRTLKADQCISTFTIELFKPANAPEGHRPGKAEIFGCDLCQDVCPWNEKALSSLGDTKEVSGALMEFFLKRPLSEIIQELENMSNKGYQKKFKGTVVERTGRIGMLKNLKKL